MHSQFSCSPCGIRAQSPLWKGNSCRMDCNSHRRILTCIQLVAGKGQQPCTVDGSWSNSADRADGHCIFSSSNLCWQTRPDHWLGLRYPSLPVLCPPSRSWGLTSCQGRGFLMQKKNLDLKKWPFKIHMKEWAGLLSSHVWKLTCIADVMEPVREGMNAP